MITAGSLLGLAIHSGISYPVGKTDEMTLYPLSYPEFVLARGGEGLYRKLTKDTIEDIDTLRSAYEDLLREYQSSGSKGGALLDVPVSRTGLDDQYPVVFRV